MAQQFTYTGSDNLEAMKEARNYNAFLVSLIENLKPTGKILDIGAGIGLYAEMLREKGYDISCLEPDFSQAEILKTKGFKVYTSVNEIDCPFDIMYALNVLEHIENDAEAITEWIKQLKYNGKLLIYVPAFEMLFSSMDKKVGHFRRYTRKLLTQKITDTHLNIYQSARYADSIGFFISLIYKLIGNKSGNINTKILVFYDRFLFPFSKICDFFFQKKIGKNVYIVVQNNLGK